jgi:hypothetical protein
VLIDDGQLATVVNSRRFKREIEDMTDLTDQLMRLRPVTFRYREQETNRTDYGLVVEEVAEIYPDLVIRGADGKAKAIHYQKLTPMLLNDVQREHHRVEVQQQRIDEQQKQIADQQRKLNAVEHAVRGVAQSPRRISESLGCVLLSRVETVSARSDLACASVWPDLRWLVRRQDKIDI